jgi:hypothetical protein
MRVGTPVFLSRLAVGTNASVFRLFLSPNNPSVVIAWSRLRTFNASYTKQERTMNAANRTRNPHGVAHLPGCFTSTLPLFGGSHTKPPATAARHPVVHEMPHTFDEAAEKLMPTIQSRALAEFRSLVANAEDGADQGFLGTPYAEHLAICVAHDDAASKRYLTAADLAKWGVPAAEVFRVALDNLKKLPCRFWEHLDDGRVLSSAADDSYDSARMLLLEIFEQMPIRGKPVVMVPHPNLLMITGTDDPQGLSLVLQRAKEVLSEPLAIGPFAFCRSEFGWQPWTPEYSPEDRRTLDRLMLDMRERDYARQQKVLADREFARPAADQQFIASYKRLRQELVAGIQTMCVWTKSAPSLLPKTDAIAFVDGTEAKGLVPWSLVANEMKAELKPVGLYPERYAVRSFPTDAQLHFLVQEATRRGVVLDRRC